MSAQRAYLQCACAPVRTANWNLLTGTYRQNPIIPKMYIWTLILIDKFVEFQLVRNMKSEQNVFGNQELTGDPTSHISAGQGWPKRGVGVAITALVPLDTQSWTAH